MGCRVPYAVVLVALAGCRQLFGLADPLPGDAHVGDGAGSGDGSAGTLCIGETGWQICVPMPTAPVTLPSQIDTESTGSGLCLSAQPSSWSGSGQPRACIVVGTVLTGSNVYATGQYPLVLVASDSISVGSIDVSSHSGGSDPGAGAGGFGCSNAGNGAANAAGAGGGAGGSFQSQGGNGGTGMSGASSGGNAANADASVPTVLHGGCRGGSGGDGSTINNHGRSGDGGGAVYLVAGTKITIMTSINASGAGGGGGGMFAGGGGGGTGGSIVLDAPTIIATGAALIANGGGGGSGGTSSGGGGNGANPSTSNPTTPAQGNGTGGGAGGNGFAGASVATSGSGSSVGGGGGGGASGYIRANVMPTGGTLSPNIDIK